MCCYRSKLYNISIAQNNKSKTEYEKEYINFCNSFIAILSFRL
ncbi:hypothetical protein BSGG_5139 [Bacteroides sp. D2]|jgi:hypothetical protein|nr:hypothetical protein BSGG_5139 [Bacteroides sp. D2]